MYEIKQINKTTTADMKYPNPLEIAFLPPDGWKNRKTSKKIPEKNHGYQI